jgi:hypothetical protein
MGRVCAPYTFLGDRMLEETADPWREILRDTINAHTVWPVPGAQFRVALNSAAHKRALQFPPAGEPRMRFVQLLERYPDVVAILRRPGQDILVAPAGRSELLAKGIQNEFYGIRHDLFGAFTIVSENRPYYDKAVDRVEWLNAGEEPASGSTWIPVERPTSTGEVKLRRDFAESPENSASRSLLLNALESPLPFQAWSGAIKATGLQRSWHVFRTKRLQEKIQRWARDNGIEWKEAWLTERPTAFTPMKSRPSFSVPLQRKDGDPVQLLFSGLDAADMQRISIPLDLVLKAISSSKG